MSGISKIIKTIRQHQESGNLGEEIYFRGQRSKEILVPSLLRNDLGEYTENNLYCDCKIMGGVELGRLESSWEYLAMFQHYGIPTRLLDWSSTLTSALYFSLSKCMDCKRKGCKKLLQSCKGNPCIWVLDPAKMHDKFYPKENMKAYSIGIDPIDEYSDCFVTDTKKWNYQVGPIFLEVPWNNPRIKRQKGYFTFHPNKTPLEDQLKERNGLIKIEIPAKTRDIILKEFETLGINEHDIYTDLISLSKYLKRKYDL